MAKKLTASKLNKRITIQQKGRTEDDAGYPVPDPMGWEDVVTIWASREPVSGREFFAAADTKYEKTVRWRIRYRSDIKEGMRLVNDGRDYHIYAVIDDANGDRTETHLMTTEVT